MNINSNNMLKMTSFTPPPAHDSFDGAIRMLNNKGSWKVLYESKKKQLFMSIADKSLKDLSKSPEKTAMVAVERSRSEEFFQRICQSSASQAGIHKKAASLHQKSGMATMAFAEAHGHAYNKPGSTYGSFRDMNAAGLHNTLDRGIGWSERGRALSLVSTKNWGHKYLNRIQHDSDGSVQVIYDGQKPSARYKTPLLVPANRALLRSAVAGMPIRLVVATLGIRGGKTRGMYMYRGLVVVDKVVYDKDKGSIQFVLASVPGHFHV